MPDGPEAAKGKPAKGETPVGKVEHYYPKAKAAAVGLTDDLKVGDEIHILGHGDDVRTRVESLQLDHVPIEAGHAGQHIGVGLAKKVHEGDDVLLVTGGGQASKARPKPAARGGAARTPKAARNAKAARTPRRGTTAKKAARKPKGPGKGRKAARKPKAPKRAKGARRASARRKPARKGALRR